jgi:hypothetical protein
MRLGIACFCPFVIAACSESAPPPQHTNAESPRTQAPAPPPPAFDALDVLPASAGGLRIYAAWRLAPSGGSTVVMGLYRWGDGVGPEAHLTCNVPPSPAECDSSVPIRLKFGPAQACGADTTAEPGEGPMIMWNGCDLRLGSGGRKEFNRLRAAAAVAIPWTRKALASNLSPAEVKANREGGLLQATRTGNPQLPSLSHQLER